MCDRTLPIAVALLVVAACAREPQEPATVTITAPEQGATLMGDSVHVSLVASGVEIAPAQGEPTPGQAHHHLFVDRGLTPAGEPIPKEMPDIIHLGTGASEFSIDDLEPGEHRIIAVLALGDHTPLDPWATDTVTFTLIADTTAGPGADTLTAPGS